MKVFLILFCLGSVMAEPYKPQDLKTVLARWPIEDMAVMQASPEAQKKQLLADLKKAQKPGHSYLYGVVHSRLATRIDDSTDPQEWLLWVQVLQHSHHFEAAQLWLAKVLSEQPHQPQAHLLLAQMAVLQQRFDAAKSSCVKLLGRSDITTANVCLLQVASHQGQLSQSYEKLADLWQGLSDNDYRLWVSLLLSEMAERLGKATEAEFWLEQIPLQDSSISHIQAWADIKLKNGQAQEVLSKLHALKKQQPYLEDGLLLRLAMAQKHFNQASKGVHNPWQQEVVQKMRLREQRADRHHAKDMALYYLEFTRDTKRALYWAEMNWQQTKENSDAVLLARARRAAEEQES